SYFVYYHFFLQYTTLFFALLFSFHDPSPPDTYTLSLHDALPISQSHYRELFSNIFIRKFCKLNGFVNSFGFQTFRHSSANAPNRSEEHTSELQSRENLVCRLLLEKKKHSSAQQNTSHAPVTLTKS